MKEGTTEQPRGLAHGEESNESPLLTHNLKFWQLLLIRNEDKKNKPRKILNCAKRVVLEDS